ncbi:MAG: type II toxin-antitoxin system VapC family toxin, partial [Thermoprotei archaeon]
MKKYLFDTSIIIDHLRGVEEARKWIEMVKKNKILGIISV